MAGRPAGAAAGAGGTVAQLIEEAQAAEKRGRRDLARAAYERALYRLRGDADAAQASAVLRWIARTYQIDADTDAALDCLEAALAVAEAHGDLSAAGHAVNVQAVVHWQRGDLDEAERLYLTARGHALRAEDAKLAAMTAQNLGVLANIRGDFDVARRHYEASLTEYRALGLTKDVCVALNNLGLLHTHRRQWDEAERAFLEAVQLSDALEDVGARILLDVNLAELWVARGEFGRAHASVRHALALAARTGDGSAIGQATKLLGVIAREAGDLEEAERHFVRADEVATARQDLLLQADVARDRAELARKMGRNRDVLQHLNRAHRLFTQLRARQDLADVGGRLGALEEQFLHVARRWGESIEAKDRYTQGHCVRVAELSCAIAERAGFDAHAVFWFRIGALLHDVGKLSVPQEVLNKPGKLDDDEWALMRRHTTAGVEMLADVDFPWDVRPIIESHHERWDGKGYPHGLAGEAIPLVARILCVADVYDALTSVRSYKRALSHDEAMQIMRRDVGTAFDPVVFAWFEAVAVDWPERLQRIGAGPGALPATPAVEAAPLPERAPARAASVPAPVTSPELDELTGMPLRRAFRVTAERVLEARRTTERPVALLVVDIDHFKLVNDTYGHQQGDDVLRLVADHLRVNTRPTDYVARYAGDEFVVLLPGTRLEEAVAVGERVRVAVGAAACPRRDGGTEPLRVTLSIGVASAPLHGDAIDALFAAADGALYGAKRRGRNAVTAASAGSHVEPELLLEGFVGRVDERQRLSRLLDRATHGDPSVVAITGEAGVGKSTLLRQLAPDVAVRAGSLLVGRCIEADVRPPYGPWRDLLESLQAAGLVPRRAWPELSRLVPALGGPTGGDAAAAAHGPADASTRYALLDELHELLRVASAARPLVMVLDDMQWADPASWDALEFLVPRLSDERLLLCLTIRDEDLGADGVARRRRLTRAERFTSVALARLGRDELSQWVRSALGGQAPEPELVEHLERHTEGNPLFAVQTVRALAAAGALRHADGRWRFRRGGADVIPELIRDLLSRRLDGLSPRTREVLTVAAVLGREFDADTLLHASGLEEDAVLEAVDEALAGSVLAPVGAPTGTRLAFPHGLLAEVLRQGANPLRLRRVHERVARALEGRPEGGAAEMARHYDRAGCTTEAYRNALEAEARAVAGYAYETATDFLAMARRHARTPEETAHVEWRCAQLMELLGRYQEAEEHCRVLLAEHAVGASALGTLAAARRMLQRLRLQRGAPAADVLAACTSLLADAHGAGDHAEAVALRTMISQAHGRLGDVAAARQVAQDALREADALGDLQLTADATVRMGSTLIDASPADAVPYYRRALDAFTRLDDRRGQLRCHINVGSACDRAGNLPAAEVAYSTALAIGREIRARDLAGAASLNLGVLMMKTGRYQVAHERFQEALSLFTTIGHEHFRLSAMYNMAHLARERGDAGGALELYSATVALAAPLGQFDIRAGGLAGAGLAELALGSPRSAVQQRDAAEELVSARPPAAWFQGRELLEALRVKLLAARGERAQARAALADAVHRAEQHDQYAAVWLSAECGSLAAGDPTLDALVARSALHARTLGYEPLVARIASAGEHAGRATPVTRDARSRLSA